MAIESSQKAIIAIIKSAITGEKYDLPEDLDMLFLQKTAKKHQVTGLIYYGACNCGISQEIPEMQKLFADTCKSVAISSRQSFETENIFSAFNENGIYFMPLKGAAIRNLYSKPEMRLMGDADILIKPEQSEKFTAVLTQLGFTYKLESDHEIIWYNQNLYLELHKRVIPSYNKDYFAYFGDGWQLAKVQNGTRFDMNDEDAFVYIFTHFAKHYRDAGVGLRHITDIWVYRREKQLNEEYICKELKKLQLLEFYRNVIATLSFWFEGGEESDVTDLITSVIFGSGVYGTHATHVVSQNLKKRNETGSVNSNKAKTTVKMLFLPYRYMCEKYPVLRKMPFLLPIMWVVRWIDILLHKKDNIERFNNDMKLVNDKNIDVYEKSLRTVGLDFNFGE